MWFSTITLFFLTLEGSKITTLERNANDITWNEKNNFGFWTNDEICLSS